jgi:saccharopine dehydrogenase (NAD+, L-lysine-forming)
MSHHTPRPPAFHPEILQDGECCGTGHFGSIGKEMFAVKIDAWGKRSQCDVLVEFLLQGINEADITAKVAAAVANFVYRSALPHGVYHIDQLFEWESILPSLPPEATIETRINGKRFY